MNKLRIVIPKGRMHESIKSLMAEAGIKFSVPDRGYRPEVNDPEIEIKIMKPQNIAKLVEMGSHDIGFTGHDWVKETSADVEDIMDLGFDPVRIVAAAPAGESSEELKRKKVIVASEYENISKEFLDREKYNYVFLRTYGATEVFPPDDADMIIDNTSTGRTLRENNMIIHDTVMTSSTRMIANKESLNDAWKYEKIEKMKMLFRSVLDARGRVMLEMNVSEESFEEVLKILPAMRSPTVSPLWGKQGYAVKIAVKKSEIAGLIPELKNKGATDILEYDIRKVIA